MEPLLTILICLISAYLLAELCRIAGLPRVIGEIGAGLILGIGAVKSTVFTANSLSILAFLANLGVILLFYYVGMETRTSAFAKNLKKSLLISLFNSILPLAIGFAIARFWLGLGDLASAIIGVCLAVSAQSVSVELLDELNILKSRIGELIISAGAVDDIVEALIVALLLSWFHFTAKSPTPEKLALDIVLFLIIIIIARIWFIPATLKFFDREHSSTSRFTASMIIVLIFAYLSETLGVGMLIGAMIAGIVVRHTIYKEVELPNWEEHDMAKSTHIIAFGFLIPLFFVWVGLNVDTSLIGQNLGLIALFFSISLAATVGGTMLAVRLSGGTLREGILVGLGITPKGDIELVVAMLALNAGIITQQIFGALVVMSMLTTIVSLIAFKRLVTYPSA